jgi:hypothetical protein
MTKYHNHRSRNVRNVTCSARKQAMAIAHSGTDTEEGVLGRVVTLSHQPHWGDGDGYCCILCDAVTWTKLWSVEQTNVIRFSEGEKAEHLKILVKIFEKNVFQKCSIKFLSSAPPPPTIFYWFQKVAYPRPHAKFILYELWSRSTTIVASAGVWTRVHLNWGSVSYRYTPGASTNILY